MCHSREEMIGEPVESSSGAYYTEVTDLKLEDLGGTFALERRYFSTVTHSGVITLPSVINSSITCGSTFEPICKTVFTFAELPLWAGV